LNNIPERFNILSSAANTVRDREGDYGSPALNFERQADFANVILKDKLKGEISAADMVLINAIAIKGSRLLNSPDHQDSQIDMAGYASLLSEVV